MQLTRREHEAFIRGQAAGLIPENVPISNSEAEAEALIVHIGVMFSCHVGGRNSTGQFFFADVSVFSEEYLPRAVRKLPEMCPDIAVVTGLRLPFRGTPLAGVANYFALGEKIVDPDDLQGRLAGQPKTITPAEVLRGFTLDYDAAYHPKCAGMQKLQKMSEQITQGGRLPIT